MWFSDLGVREDAKDILFLEDEAIFIVNFQLTSRVLIEQDLIPYFHVLPILADRLDAAALGFSFADSGT